MTTNYYEIEDEIFEELNEQMYENFNTNIKNKVSNTDKKLKLTLIPPEVLEELAKVLNFGAEKYSVDNWKEQPNPKEHYMNALLRHIVEIQKGNNIDTESNLPHISHVLANATYLSYFNTIENKYKTTDVLDTLHTNLKIVNEYTALINKEN